MTRVLLGQLGANGDCLYATTIARQIRQDFPGAELTWAISPACRRAIDNNPHVDCVWEVVADDASSAWLRLTHHASLRDFDHVFLTQIHPDGYANYDGTVRPSLLRNYGRPITVPIETVIVLTPEEREHVAVWAERHHLSDFENVILFECSSRSGQSFLTPMLGAEIARQMIVELPQSLVILGTAEPAPDAGPGIVFGGDLSLRETAELSTYASLFVSCGSGVTVAATSSAAKPNLPIVQILARETSVFASLKHDLEYFGKPASHVVETTSMSLRRLAQTVITAVRDGAAEADRRYGNPAPLNFNAYCRSIDNWLLRRGRHADACRSLATTIQRYGPRSQLIGFGRSLIAPFLSAEQRRRLWDPIEDLSTTFPPAVRSRDAG
jgi:hypothetical protein